MIEGRRKAYDYMWEQQVYRPLQQKDLSSWQAKTGPLVLARKDDGTAEKVCFRLLVDCPKQEIYLLCDANGWTKEKSFLFTPDEHSVYYSLTTTRVGHGQAYLLLVNAEARKDPASAYFDSDGRCVFYDGDDPRAYRMIEPLQNPIERSQRILQTDLLGFIYHWKHKSKDLYGKDVPAKDTFSFITQSGILSFVKELGFNALQFLPFAQSIDGGNWKFRYLVVYPFALDQRYGTPDEFRRMVDACHRHGISIIDDVVLGHLPDREYAVFGRIGDLHHWRDRHGQQLFMDEETSWGTRRPNFKNAYVRRFLIDSCLRFVKEYRIDGFRIDNVDGILRYGPAGEGEDRPGGRTFLRDLARELYTYHRYCLISYEAHYFHEDNAKMLVAPLDSDDRALGGTAYNSSRTTFYFHKEFMLKTAKECSIWRLRHIAEEKEWGRSNSCIADFHNHDAAAGLMHGRATGAYAYPCMTLGDPKLHLYALGKIKVMEGIISLLMEGRTLDLMQTFLLQEGTFEHDTGIVWGRVFSSRDAQKMQNFKRDINRLMDAPAFWPLNNHTRHYLNVDDNCKVLAVSRKDARTSEGDTYVVVINCSDYEHSAYCVGVREEGSYECVFNSDDRKYGGSGATRYYDPVPSRPSTKFGLLDKEIDIGTLAPFGISVFRLRKKVSF